MRNLTLRLILVSGFLLLLRTSLLAINCPDTQPVVKGPDVVRAGQTVTYMTNDIPGHTYNWTLSGGGSIAGSNTSNQVIVNWGNTPTSATLSITEKNSAVAGCTGISAQKTITIQPLLNAYFYYEFDPTHGCFYNEITATATGDGNFPPVDPTISFTWKWRLYDPLNVLPWNTTGIVPGSGPNIVKMTLPKVPKKTYEVDLQVSKTISGSVYTDEIVDYVYVDPDKYKPTAVISSVTPPFPNCLYNQYTCSASGSSPSNFPDPSITIKYCYWYVNDVLVRTKANGIDTMKYTFPAPGSYTIKLIIENSYSCKSNAITSNVTITNTVPVANFTAEAACVDIPTVFNDFSLAVVPSGTLTKWEWNWGDGTPNTIYGPAAIPPAPKPATIEHTYTEVGIKHITLQVTNSNGCISPVFTQDVNVIPSPIANFEYDFTCANTLITFRDRSITNGGSDIISRQWNFGDGNWTTNPTYTFTTTGPQTVTLKVTNANYCTDTKVDNSIIIHPIPDFTPDPAVGFTWANTTLPLEIQFSDYTDPLQVGNNLQWDFGDGKYGFGKNPVHNYGNPGEYNVQMTCTSTFGCTNFYQAMIKMAPPIPSFYFDPSEACLDKEVRVVPNPVAGTIAKEEWWYQDEGYTPDPSLPSPYTVKHSWVIPVVMPAADTHFFKSYGIKQVNHVITLSGTPPTIVAYNDYVTIHDTAKAEFTWNNINQPPVGGPPLPGCKGQEVFFFDRSTPPVGSPTAQIVGWLWEFDDPASSGSNYAYTQDCSHIFMDPGKTTFHVKLTVTSSDNNCESFTIKTITIKPSPLVNFIVNGNSTANVGCMSTPDIPAVVNFAYDPTVIPDPTQIKDWLWEFGDNISQSGPFLSSTSHAYLTSGWKTVKLTITDADGCRNTISKSVYINPAPIASFSFTPDACEGQAVQFDDHSQAGGDLNAYVVKWEWFWGDGSLPSPEVITNSQTVSHTFPIVPGMYTWPVKLRVTTNYGCISEITIPVTLKASPVTFFEVEPLTPQCMSPQSVRFQDRTVTSSATGPITNWVWDFADGTATVSGISNPSHVFINAGSYAVSLTVTTANGCSKTYVATPPVVVNQRPVADFTANTPCENNPTVFTSNSTPNATAITSYLWEFGDGNTSTQPSPSHTYLTYGNYSVKLTVTNSNGCIHDTTKQVSVYPKPNALFSFSPSSCIGIPVDFVDHSTVPGAMSSYIQTWQWDFGDGSSQPPINYPANPNISHTFSGTVAIHTVRLTVTTSAGCISFIDKVVTSIPSPISNFSFSTTNCTAQPVQFTDHSQENGGGPITAWQWNFGDPASGSNTSTLQNPTHSFTAAATYTVHLKVFNASGCYKDSSTTITIAANPTADFTATNVCKSSPTVFTGSASGGTIVTWSWNFGDGGTSNAQSPSYTYANSGSYNVMLTVTTAAGCQGVVSKSVQVYGSPVSQFSFSSTACSSDSVQFTDLSTTPHGSIHDWYWDFGDGGTSHIVFPGNQNVKHKYANGGSFNVKLSITTTDSCKNEVTIPVTVEAKPIANYSNSSGACALMSNQFTDLSQANGGTPIISWLWNFGDPASGSYNTSTLKNPTHVFTAGMIFSVKLIIYNATGCLDSLRKDITVNAAPVPIFSFDTACVNSPTQFIDASTSPTGIVNAWLWDFGDPSSGTNNSSTLPNPVHYYSVPGNYMVKLFVTNTNNCSKDTTKQISVSPKPQALFQYSAACAQDSTSFTDLSIAANSQVVAWSWNFGDGGTDTIKNPKHKYAASGTYSVKEVITNLSGCKDSVTISVLVHAKPLAAFQYTSKFCPAGQVTFQDLSTAAGAAITDHLWIFEPGATSTVPNPVYTFSATGGTYSVTLIVMDNFGCKDTIISSVSVKPAFKFTYTNDMVCLGYPTHFTPVNNNPGQDSLYSPRWDFGDPNSGPANYSNLYNASHIFTAPGSFYVKLKVFNSDNCLDSVFKIVQVYAPPKPHFRYTAPQCDSALYFVDTTSNFGTGTIASWEWHFGDNSAPFIIPAPGPGSTSHIYAQPGDYKVTLIITNTKGCVDSISQGVTRLPCIKAAYDYPDTLRCMNYMVTFHDTSVPTSRINEWKWTWDDGTDTTYSKYAQYVKHRFTSPGTFNVKLWIRTLVNSVIIRDSNIQQVIIHPTPKTLFSDVPVCLHQAAIFRDTSLTNGEAVSVWKWNFGEPSSGPGNTSTLRNPTHTYATRDTFNVQLVVMNKFGCKDSLTKPLRIYGLPVASFSYLAACTGDPTFFRDSSAISDTTIGFWRWNFGDPTVLKDTSVLRDPIFKYKSGGDYLVRLIVRDHFGCKDTIDSTVTVHVTPVSAFTLINGYDGTPGKVKLNNQSKGASAYSWDFGNGKTSNDTNPIATYSEDGTYSIRLVSMNDFGCTDTTYYEYKILFRGLFVPNAFAPNSGNLAVRLFKPVGINLKTYHIMVFDAGGHLMWESNKLDNNGAPLEGWDGTVNGVLMPQGNYFWKATATFIDDSSWTGSDTGVKGGGGTMGTVILLR